MEGNGKKRDGNLVRVGRDKTSDSLEGPQGHQPCKSLGRG